MINIEAVQRIMVHQKDMYCLAQMNRKSKLEGKYTLNFLGYTR